MKRQFSVTLAILLPLAFSSDVRIRGINTINEGFVVNKKQKSFTVSTTSDGTTTVIVQVKNGVYFVLDDTMKKKVEIKLEDTTVMALELNDTSKMHSWYNNSDVLSIEPDYPVQLFENNYNSVQDDNTTTSRNLQDFIPYGIDMVLQNKRSKFRKMKAKGSVKICVADTGYDINHNDLPKSPDVTGTDAAGERWYYDGNSHGTHVAGTIAAKDGNGGGVYGVIPNNYKGKFKLLIAKAFNAEGVGTNSGVLASIQDCAKMGANIISMSLGCVAYSKECYSPSMESYLQSLYDNDVLLIAAAGNDGSSYYSYPASYESVISVASIEQNKARSSYSQYNDQVELSAPGGSVWSTVPGNTYSRKSGTSMATPHVAGVAGLLRMAFPKCSSKQIRMVMAYTAKDLDVKGCDVRTGFGLVQANRAFKLLKKNCGELKGNPVGGCYKLKKKNKS